MWLFPLQSISFFSYMVFYMQWKVWAFFFFFLNRKNNLESSITSYELKGGTLPQIHEAV